MTMSGLLGQTCPVLNTPMNGDINVPVEAAISWDIVTGVTGYKISIGTTPSGTEIINQRAVGSSTSFTPPLGLPENTQIYVTITLFFFDQPDITCTTESFTTEDVVIVPSCSAITNPVNGETNVNSATNLVWDYADKATSYQLAIGTSPGSDDIVNQQDVGNVLSYNPLLDLPASTQIYVRIIPTNENGSAVGCIEETFTTGAIATLPSCAQLISPANGDINVPLTPFLEWTDVADAVGYRVTIGNSPFSSEIVDNVTFPDNSTFVINFEPNRTFFITITPFNAAGDAIGCTQESFSTLLGCGPYFDSVSGELVTHNPEINLPDVIPICSGELPSTYSTMDLADGFRWFKIDQFGNETLISDSPNVDFTDSGDYRYEAYTIISQLGDNIECPTTKLFRVESSGIATITSIQVSEQVNDVNIEINVEGDGDYEFSLNSDGPYQSSNTFQNIPKGQIRVFVRDKNGCGMVEESVEQDLSVEGFPKFFTPNGDGINDFWQYIPSELNDISDLSSIFIYNRYGLLLSQIEPTSLGWDGRFRGNALPASDYWFMAVTKEEKRIKGHFTLKR